MVEVFAINTCTNRASPACWQHPHDVTKTLINVIRYIAAQSFLLLHAVELLFDFPAGFVLHICVSVRRLGRAGTPHQRLTHKRPLAASHIVLTQWFRRQNITGARQELCRTAVYRVVTR